MQTNENDVCILQSLFITQSGNKNESYTHFIHMCSMIGIQIHFDASKLTHVALNDSKWIFEFHLLNEFEKSMLKSMNRKKHHFYGTW